MSIPGEINLNYHKIVCIDDNGKKEMGDGALLPPKLAVRDFIHDDGAAGKAISSMAYIPPFITAGLPQAALNGLEMGNFFVDVYKNSQPSATSESRGVTAANIPGAIAACSRPGVVPWTDIDWLNARIAASNRVINGRACHLITPYEKASLLYLQLMSNFVVKGNNNNGKDTRDGATFDNYGILDPVKPDYRTLTGTGPASWWSNGIPGAGIFGMVANIYSWEDARLANGLYQPKGYLNGVLTAGNTKLNYDDNAGGDGVDICHLMPGIYTIVAGSYTAWAANTVYNLNDIRVPTVGNGHRYIVTGAGTSHATTEPVWPTGTGATVVDGTVTWTEDGTIGAEDVTIERSIITGRFSGIAILSSAIVNEHLDNAAIQLKTAVDISVGEAGAYKAIGKLLEDATSKKLAFPDKADTTTHIATYLDSWYAKSIVDCALRRGGNWNITPKARRGLIVNSNNTPVNVYYNIGLRSALSIGNL